jgi:hypothetical protein
VCSQTEFDSVRSLLAAGRTTAEISRRTGIPQSTVGHWRRAERRGAAIDVCARCGHPVHRFESLPGRGYSYLLGAYLGDGHITKHARDVYRLTIYCSLIHINVAWWMTLAAEAVVGRRVAMRPDPVDSVLYVQSHSKQWPCLLPQHGPGHKHDRSIALVDWQQRIVDAHPDQLLRGLIHSDGCRTINRIRGARRTYEYARYEFSNRSQDIRRIFCHACDALGVEWRVMKPDVISVARRASVAKLDAFIGPSARPSPALRPSAPGCRRRPP